MFDKESMHTKKNEFRLYWNNIDEVIEYKIVKQKNLKVKTTKSNVNNKIQK